MSLSLVDRYPRVPWDLLAGGDVHERREELPDALVELVVARAQEIERCRNRRSPNVVALASLIQAVDREVSRR